MAELKGLTVKAKVAEGGRIVIPTKLRQALGIEIGENVTLSVKNNILQITTQKEALRRIRALVRKHVPEGVSLVDELIKDRREEAAND
jgi:bifunctional DNA-binding transcriptional regulator/antitoxin component of YhaV-PrlF toxin-antitoxin module